jgi:hypothetical protein
MRVLEKNGLGDDTCMLLYVDVIQYTLVLTCSIMNCVIIDFPPGIHFDKPNISLPLARAEAECVMYEISLAYTFCMYTPILTVLYCTAVATGLHVLMSY